MIKKLTQKDIEKVVELHRIAIFPIWDKLDRKYSLKGVKKFSLDILRKGEVFGFVENNELEGIIGVEIYSKRFEIGVLLVNPVHQGKGIGKKLMAFVENKYKKSTSKLSLEVLIKNPAVKFYEKLGYNIIKIDHKKQKYFMEKDL